MNQTMSTSFELKKPAGLQAGRGGCDFRSTHFISNIQNVSQNIQQHFPQNFQASGQPKSDPPGERNPTNPKATSSMISSEIFTHYKKQKIQNLMNESNSTAQPIGLNAEQPLPTTNSSKCDFRGAAGLSLAAKDSKPGANFSILNQINQTASQLSNQLSNQLISQFGNAQSVGYPESSVSSPASTGSSDSNEPTEHDHPVDLKIKSVAQRNANGNNPDTSCSSNEFKDDSHQDYFAANSDLLNKINLASQMSMFQRNANHDLQSVLDKIELKIIKEPAKYHRARYMTEGRLFFLLFNDLS